MSEFIGRMLFIQTGIGLRIPGRFNQPYDVEGPSDHRSHRGSGDYLHAGDHLDNEIETRNVDNRSRVAV